MAGQRKHFFNAYDASHYTAHTKRPLGASGVTPSSSSKHLTCVPIGLAYCILGTILSRTDHELEEGSRTSSGDGEPRIYSSENV